MKRHRMRFPDRSCFETRAQRRERVALTRRAAAVELDAPAAPEVVEARASARGLSMSLAAFRAADYGQVCQFLGLSPSRPRSSRRRRRSAPAHA